MQPIQKPHLPHNLKVLTFNVERVNIYLHFQQCYKEIFYVTVIVISLGGFSVHFLVVGLALIWLSDPFIYHELEESDNLPIQENYYI